MLGKDDTEGSSADGEDDDQDDELYGSEFDREFDSDPPLDASVAERIGSWLCLGAMFLVVAASVMMM